ncbi:MAG: hypothetical protein ACT4ON_06625 [Bacteroidota bacterium]
MENTDDLKKYFNSKEYITTIVGGEEEIKSQKITGDKIAALISLLTDPKNKDIKEEALLALKREKGGEVLLAAIASPNAEKDRHILVAACWESEINFSKYLPFFITLALSTDYLVSLEAITVIENMEGPFNEAALKDGIKKIKEQQKNIANERVVLFNDLVNTLQNFLSSSGQMQS